MTVSEKQFIYWGNFSRLCHILTEPAGLSYREPGGVSLGRLGERRGLEGGPLHPGRGVQ